LSLHDLRILSSNLSKSTKTHKNIAYRQKKSYLSTSDYHTDKTNMYIYEKENVETKLVRYIELRE